MDNENKNLDKLLELAEDDVKQTEEPQEEPQAEKTPVEEPAEEAESVSEEDVKSKKIFEIDEIKKHMEGVFCNYLANRKND